MTCRHVAVSNDAARAETTSPPFVAVARMLRRFESLRKSAPPRSTYRRAPPLQPTLATKSQFLLRCYPVYGLGDIKPEHK